MWVENVSYVWSKGCRRPKIEGRTAPRSDKVWSYTMWKEVILAFIFMASKMLERLPN